MESKSISFINSIHDFFTFSCFCSHPLFSIVVTLHTLILLYAPSFFLRVVLSPILNSTGILLLLLLKLGANEGSGKDLSSQEVIVLGPSENGRPEKESSNQTATKFKPDSSFELESNQINVELEHNIGSECNSQDDRYKGELLDTNSMKSPQVVEKGETRMKMDSIQVETTMKLLEWNLKVPLEIIYESYEGEEDNDSNEDNKDFTDKLVMGCVRYPSLSMYYPEIETDSSSDDDFSVNEMWETKERVLFKWEMEDDERDELIEISLDHYGKRSIEFCQDEEDSLIEIDIFPQQIE